MSLCWFKERESSKQFSHAEVSVHSHYNGVKFAQSVATIYLCCFALGLYYLELPLGIPSLSLPYIDCKQPFALHNERKFLHIFPLIV